VESIKTSRDLYLAVAELVKRQANAKRSLETYLLALLNLAKNLKNRKALSPDEFLDLLTRAFNEEPLRFDKSWRNLEHDPSLENYAAWQNTILCKIVDLREMAEQGTLNDKMRYFGIDAPRGSRWYNFDPCTFLECGVMGTFGGWQEGDDTGRDYVPGPVAVLDEAGNLTSAEPRDLGEPVVALEAIPWATFCQFLIDGQSYE
jgi:hypothetical protein